MIKEESLFTDPGFATILKAEYLQDFVDNAAVALHWVDQEGIIKWANRAELDMLGYEPQEYIGQPISRFHADQDKIRDILSKLAGNETLKGYIAPLRCKDGSIRTVSISSNVFRHNGKFLHTRCFTIDITEQIVLSRALSQAESSHRQLLENLPAALYTTDAEGKVTFYNKAAVEIWGREPVLGKDQWCGSWKIFRPDGSVLPLDSCPMAIALKEARAVWGEEIIVMHPDGSTRHVAPFPQPLLNGDGQLVGAFNMLMDITNIRQSEKLLKQTEQELRQLNISLEQKIEQRTKELTAKNEELKKSEERYHKMVAEVQDYAILLLDEKGFIQNWNTGAEKIKGYRFEEIIGRHFSVFYLPEDRQNLLPEKLMEEAERNGKALHEGWRVRKDGTTFWGSIVITAIHDDQNRVIGFTKVTRDLSEKKLNEDKIKDYTAQLEVQNKELEQFAFAASHDMKEPLRKIRFYTQAVVENTVDTLDEKNKEYLRRAAQAAERMQTLIQDILDYTKNSSLGGQFTDVDVAALIDEFTELHKEEIDQESVVIHYENLPVIRGIPFQISQLVSNILNNSMRYRHKDRPCKIYVSGRIATPSEVQFADAKQENYWLLSFTDNGIGFDNKYAQQIFRIFERLHARNVSSGSGIGLAICKKIVQNHRGFISAEGEVDEGARFDIYLPVLA